MKDTYTIKEVAELLSEAIGDSCVCNVNGNDEWLPYICEHTDKCPDVADCECWEQYLKYKEQKKRIMEIFWNK